MAALISLSRQGGVGIRRYAHPVDVEDIDVARTQLLQRGLDGNMHRFHIVADVVDLLRDSRVAMLVVGRVLISREELFLPGKGAAIDLPSSRSPSGRG